LAVRTTRAIVKAGQGEWRYVKWMTCEISHIASTVSVQYYRRVPARTGGPCCWSRDGGPCCWSRDGGPYPLSSYKWFRSTFAARPGGLPTYEYSNSNATQTFARRTWQSICGYHRCGGPSIVNSSLGHFTLGLPHEVWWSRDAMHRRRWHKQ
jgi:hypothetical protein